MGLVNGPVLVTGGTGFIGSHTVVELLHAGEQVVLIDDLSNSTTDVLSSIAAITGANKPPLEIGDIRDRQFLDSVIAQYKPRAAIHFAAKKAVGESVEQPTMYFNINIGGTATLLDALHDAGIRNIIFSSSCSVHGETTQSPLNEDSPTQPANPYAFTKLTGERMLSHLVEADDSWSAISLRYFNPIGAHPSGILGESGLGRPLNIMPWLLDVAAGRKESLDVYGDDWPTPDGTCIRDYLHVVDVARVHVRALEHFTSGQAKVFNVGTGVGTSVLELITTMEKASGQKIPYNTSARRAGDVSVLVADAQRVATEWGWVPEFNVFEMCSDAWRFDQKIQD
ncbi:UDP-glucose 4-epimerase GalE [Corynebacterium crudilactis]|uniref:UDP-glucose 4-epimerase n=1 Tax=Corynebacterium crudilactis TaxID=1652495 RepID=A0A172QRE4_9CORY|nr:UDP-glucose 4-epimerase GalE [Corynebacterium crudilactis]ANE03256.1 UDP-glucose 4-epimerase GalE [Corynebacterium crudilactis]